MLNLLSPWHRERDVVVLGDPGSPLAAAVFGELKGRHHVKPWSDSVTNKDYASTKQMLGNIVSNCGNVDALVCCWDSHGSSHAWGAIDWHHPDGALLQKHLPSSLLGQMRLAHLALECLPSSASVTLTNSEAHANPDSVFCSVAGAALESFVRKAPSDKARLNVVRLKPGPPSQTPREVLTAYISAVESNIRGQVLPKG